jgi:methionine biosynthesis protein MetW
MDLRDYYDRHWADLPEGQVDYKRLEMIVARVEPGERVLEAGCGPGFLAKLLKDKGANVIGTDVSRVGAERTARRGIETHHVDLDTTKLPFPDQSFDTVVCNSNLEHLFHLEQNLAECIRVLRVGGKFIWMEPNTAHWRYRLWLLFGRFPYIPESPTDPYHIRHVTAYELMRLCRANGLEVRELLGHAGLWCRGLYPKWFYMRGIARVVHAIYPTLVRLRPHFFARYLFVRAEKKVHIASRGAAPAHPAAHPAPTATQAKVA